MDMHCKSINWSLYNRDMGLKDTLKAYFGNVIRCSRQRLRVVILSILNLHLYSFIACF